MATLTRSQHPDLRLFTQVPGKLGWLSNKSYKTYKGVDNFLYSTVLEKGAYRRGITYSIVTIRGEYRVLATPVKKEGAA